MVFDAFAKKVIAGIALVIAEQPGVAEGSRKGVRLVFEGDLRLVFAAEAAMPRALGAAQEQLLAWFEEDGIGEGIVLVVEVGGRDDARV